MNQSPAHQSPATVADLYAVDGKAELVNGNLVSMPPTGGTPSFAASEVFVSLRFHARKTGHGFAVNDNAGFLVQLPNRRSFSPDAAFWIGAPPTLKFFEGAPVFAVEVRSETDYGPAAERAIAAKRADYFAAGTLIVWDVEMCGITGSINWQTDAVLDAMIEAQLPHGPDDGGTGLTTASTGERVGLGSR